MTVSPSPIHVPDGVLDDLGAASTASAFPTSSRT